MSKHAYLKAFLLSACFLAGRVSLAQSIPTDTIYFGTSAQSPLTGGAFSSSQIEGNPARPINLSFLKQLRSDQIQLQTLGITSVIGAAPSSAIIESYQFDNDGYVMDLTVSLAVLPPSLTFPVNITRTIEAQDITALALGIDALPNPDPLGPPVHLYYASSVPEPSSSVFMGAALAAGFLASRRIRKRSTAD